MTSGGVRCTELGTNALQSMMLVWRKGLHHRFDGLDILPAWRTCTSVDACRGGDGAICAATPPKTGGQVLIDRGFRSSQVKNRSGRNVERVVQRMSKASTGWFLLAQNSESLGRATEGLPADCDRHGSLPNKCTTEQDNKRTLTHKNTREHTNTIKTRERTITRAQEHPTTHENKITRANHKTISHESTTTQENKNTTKHENTR